MNLDLYTTMKNDFYTQSNSSSFMMKRCIKWLQTSLLLGGLLFMSSQLYAQDLSGVRTGTDLDAYVINGDDTDHEAWVRLQGWTRAWNIAFDGRQNGTQDLHWYFSNSYTNHSDRGTLRMKLTDGGVLYLPGKIGIGTDSPYGNFEIRSNTNVSALLTIDQRGTTQFAGTVLRRGGAEKWFTGMNNADDDYILRYGAANDFFVFKTNGRLGLGIQNPAELIDINGGIYTRDKGIRDWSHLRLIADTDNNADEHIIFGFDGDFTNYTERMRLTNGGNLGIGIAVPTAKLHVYDNARTAVTIQTGNNLTGNNGIAFQNQAGAYTWNIFRTDIGGSNADLVFAGGLSDNIGQLNNVLRLSATGDVSIGSGVVAGYKLAVNGKVRAHEVELTYDNWPDYVFEKNYALKSIEEVETYIEKEGHLPGLPAAKQVEAAGLGVAATNKMLVEKVEELTLYIIQLKKEIDALKAEK